MAKTHQLLQTTEFVVNEDLLFCLIAAPHYRSDQYPHVFTSSLLEHSNIARLMRCHRSGNS